FDRHGNAYVTLALTGEVRKIAPDGTQTTNPFNTVVRVTPGGAVEVLLTAADGLDGPTAAAFGVRGDNQNLYVTNAAFPFFPGPDPRRPGIMRVHVGTPGKPRP
ncbi:MAG TPA: hypothetical protein VN228_14870, partial [Pyrinomonadaceae bacterium]|nr:hypothetical protein [Pyrinomonadaceae bacterium]